MFLAYRDLWKLLITCERIEKTKQKFKEKLPNNPHDLVERFSCNSNETECIFEKCISCKSSDLIDREKCPNTEVFCSVFSRIPTKYGEIRSISPYSVRIRENAEQKNLRIWTIFWQFLVESSEVKDSKFCRFWRFWSHWIRKWCCWGYVLPVPNNR